jgi:hypothetical protein
MGTSKYTPVQTGTGLQTDTLVHAWSPGTEITVRSVTHNDKNQETNRGIFCPENPKERRFHGTYVLEPRVRDFASGFTSMTRVRSFLVFRLKFGQPKHCKRSIEAKQEG